MKNTMGSTQARVAHEDRRPSHAVRFNKDGLADGELARSDVTIAPGVWLGPWVVRTGPQGAPVASPPAAPLSELGRPRIPRLFIEGTHLMQQWCDHVIAEYLAQVAGRAL